MQETAHNADWVFIVGVKFHWWWGKK